MNRNANRNRDMTVSVAESWKDFGEKRPAFDFAEDMIRFLAVLPALFVPAALLKSPPSAYLAAAALPADFAVLTAVRLRVRRWWTFGLLVAGVTAAFLAFFIPLQAWSAAAAAFVAALVCVHKLKAAAKRRRKEREELISEPGEKTYLGREIIYLSFFICLAVYFFAFARQISWMMALCVCTFVAVCDAMLVYTHHFGESRFLQWEKAVGDTERRPPKAGRGAFPFLATVCCCASAAALWLVFSLCGISRADAALLDFLRSRGNSTDRPPEIPDASAGPSLSAGQLSKLAGSNPPSPFWTAVGTILKIALIVFAAGAVILLAAAGIRALVRCLCRSGDIPEERRSVFPGRRAGTAAGKRLRRAARDIGLFARRSNRIKIRRMFLAFVRRHRSAGAAGSDAPTEIARKIGGDSLDGAAAIYERARYGKDECAGDDVARMRESLRPAGNRQKG